MMRYRLAYVLLLSVGAACPAQAKVKTTVKVQTYAVAGDTGAALVDQMDSKGPRQGFAARAIAQTTYAIDWELQWRQAGKACRLQAATATLAIGYRYPALANAVPAALGRRWRTFLAGARQHEETHGRIARQMVADADRAVKRVGFDNDPSCKRSLKEVERIVGGVYAEYEKRQEQFDRIEHRDGGHVDRLVKALIGSK